jgi:uncharacterized peroxidase-related enzyme
MTAFAVHTLETAPSAARPALEGLKKGLGFVPNLYAVMADAPPVLDAALALAKGFDATSLTPTERQVVLLTTSSLNECAYCMAAHTAIAGMQKVPGEVVQALRGGSPLPDARLEALRAFAQAVVTERGRVPEDVLAAFLAAGFTRTQALEVLLGVAQKTLTNYVNHLADTPLDAGFRAHAWEPEAVHG